MLRNPLDEKPAFPLTIEQRIVRPSLKLRLQDEVATIHPEASRRLRREAQRLVQHLNFAVFELTGRRRETVNTYGFPLNLKRRYRRTSPLENLRQKGARSVRILVTAGPVTVCRQQDAIHRDCLPQFPGLLAIIGDGEPRHCRHRGELGPESGRSPPGSPLHR